MALNIMRFITDPNGENTFARPAPSYVDGKALAADTPETFTKPTGARFAIFSATADFYCNPDGPPAVVTDVSDGTGSELNPAIYSVDEITTLSVISAATCLISIAWYK